MCAYLHLSEAHQSATKRCRDQIADLEQKLAAVVSPEELLQHAVLEHESTIKSLQSRLQVPIQLIIHNRL